MVEELLALWHGSTTITDPGLYLDLDFSSS
jgi:hypothetical protein